MRRKSGEQGSAAVAFTLATFLLIFTIVTVYLFVAKIWWFPPAISQFGTQIDEQFHRTLIITGIVFVLAQLGLALAIFRSRERGQKVSFFEGNSAMEFLWTLATIIMFVGLGLYGEHDDGSQRPEELHRRIRSEEHTSELQSRQYLVCRLLLE